MNILVIGDVVGRCGRNVLLENISDIKREYDIDFTIVNGENATTGNGISEKYASLFLESGIDVITLGNHSFDKLDLFHFLETDNRIIRPLNLSPDLPGDGVGVYEFNGIKICVINIIGKTYIDGEISSPFTVLKKAVENVKRKYNVKIIIVDFHAEATSEKQALAYYMDGEISFIYGTHTHVQTNDARILNNKTAYITDIGMTGSEDSVIGLEKEIGINRFISSERQKFKWGDKNPMINGAVIDIDENTGFARSVSLIYKRY